MRLLGRATFLVTALAMSSCTVADSDNETLEPLSTELVEMMREDQRYRDIESIMRMPEDEQQAFLREGEASDARHTARLKEIVAIHGWPTRSLVGEEAAHAAFVLVQHADLDPEFQAQMLPLLEVEAKKGEVRRADLAYLTDRVRVKQGRPQLYGTQYRVLEDASGSAIADSAGNLTYLLPIVEDLDGLEERRADAGLEPWIDYERRMAEIQGREPADHPLSDEQQ